MLSDVFLDRYDGVILWRSWRPSDKKLIVQCCQILSDDLFPKALKDGNDLNERHWKKASDQLCRELGCASLSATKYQTVNNAWWPYTLRQQAVNFLMSPPTSSDDIDWFMKSRLSYVELMFRIAFGRVQDGEKAKMKGQAWLHTDLKHDKAILETASNELNVRMARAGAPLNYHNGFIQVSRDSEVAAQVERPFWNLVDQPKWSNVDLEMKEAIDRRDSGASDASFHAGKALESAIKVINFERGWLTGKEKGGADHASNLWSAAGGRMLEEWQVQSLKHIFSKLRNPFGHGAGPAEPISLSSAEIDWAISMCMTWISLLVRTHNLEVQATLP